MADWCVVEHAKSLSKRSDKSNVIEAFGRKNNTLLFLFFLTSKKKFDPIEEGSTCPT